eukprot:2976951-Rhodomonas_salina.1
MTVLLPKTVEKEARPLESVIEHGEAAGWRPVRLHCTPHQRPLSTAECTLRQRPSTAECTPTQRPQATRSEHKGAEKMRESI